MGHSMDASDLGPMDDGLQDLGLPVPVQTFLWTQIAPFIRPKLGKLHEATCMFCQHAPGHYELKEACKYFEKVLVQNIQFGLSLPLTSALQSIGRWRLVQAALPHVMHCAATLLHSRVKDLQTLGTAETKLLYTLHWILLFASEECADEEADTFRQPGEKRHQPYLFSIPTISLFVYLFAPIAHHLKESDFQNFRLENGLRLWQGMWEFKAPGAPCFTAPVKPKARQLLCPISPQGSVVFNASRKASETSPQSVESPQSTSAEFFVKCYPSPAEDEAGSWVSSPKDCVFPETIPEEASSVEEERVVIFRLPASSNIFDQPFYTADASLLQQQSKSPPSAAQTTKPETRSRFTFDKIDPVEKSSSAAAPPKTSADQTPKVSTSTEKDSNDGGSFRSPNAERPRRVVDDDDDNGDDDGTGAAKADVCAATFLDVAVLRCLFVSHWQEDGVYWALHYLYNRLREMSDEVITPAPQQRRRSNSLPIPQIEISVYQGPTSSRDSPTGSSITKDFIDLPDQPIALAAEPVETPQLARRATISTGVVEETTSLSGSATGAVRRSSEKKRRVKMADLRTLIETRMFSKSDRTLERVGIDATVVSEKPREQPEYHSSLDTGDVPLNLLTRDPHSNLLKGKSMPSLRYVEPPRIIRGSQSSGPRTTFSAARNPIITVTEHTPTPSPDYMRRQGSFDSQLDALSTTGSAAGAFRATQMLRSHTDSHIDYSGADESEAPGSSFYITREGGLDYEIVLLAVYTVFKRDSALCSLRVLETGLNICELLIDLGVMKLGEHAHSLSMGIAKRTLLHLGCPHGCNDGIRGPPAEFLRTQCQGILSRMLRQAPVESRRYLREMVKTAQLHELIEFFHAFVGFCVDPSSLLSPLNQNKRHTVFKTFTSEPASSAPGTTGGGQGGYATNFSGGSSGGAESQVIGAVFRTLVTRFVDAFKELKNQENIALYCDVRQLVTYVKGAHGGPFRLVALSGILAVTPRPNKKVPTMQTTRVIRHIQHTTDATSSTAINPHQASTFGQSADAETRSQRKLFFKKRSTSSACASSLLETDGLEDQCRISQSPLSHVRAKKGSAGVRPMLTPRHSERALLSDSTSSSERNNSVGRLSGIVRWFRRSSKERCSVDLEAGMGPDLAASLIRQGSLKIQGRRAGDGLGRSLQRARRRVERRLGRMGIGKGKKKVSGIEEVQGGAYSRRSSYDFGEGPRESEVVVLKERRLVPAKPVRDGMHRFSFLLEVCIPGSVPDPQLIAAVLDLPQAPLVTRATLLLECAHFVHMCNRGQWPSWMKQNIPPFRQSTVGSRAPLASGARRGHVMQRAAGKMFYQWAEILGLRLEEMLAAEKQTFDQINQSLNDPEKQKELLLQDEEEDFLDEACVNPHGNDCPPALKLIACVLLYEITAFLRETYQTLPKASKMATKEKPAPWEKVYREANRRWSMALSSMGHSQTSAQSLQSIAGGGGGPGAVGGELGPQTERKISFVLHEPDNESEGSSNTTVTVQGEEGAATGGNAGNSGVQQRRPGAPSRPFLLRRGTSGAPTGGSFKRRSLKLRRGTKDGKDIEADLRRTDSIQSRRKVSSLSDRSDNSEPGQASGGEESPGILSDDQPPESPSDSNESDETAKNMPWMRALLQVMNSFNFYCTHQNFCHPYCYRRHMRASCRLMKAVRKIYGEEFGIDVEQNLPTRQGSASAGPSAQSSSGGFGTGRRTVRNRKVSDQSSSQTSPKRKESLAKKDRIIHDDATLNLPPPSKTPNGEPSKPATAENTAVHKYIKNHVRTLFHFPAAALLKGAAILSEDLFVEAIPAAWELLLETDQETAANSAALFIIASVRAPSFASDIMQRALKHKDTNVRIGAILRYQVLWKARYQVWPRMEEGAHVSFKVPPPGIEFTLPSPKIGTESLAVVDPPWVPRTKTKDMEVTLNQERHRSLVTATKTRKKQQTEAIRHAIQQQEDKQRAERQSFLLTTIPINHQASHEPGLDHNPAEDHTEGEEEGEGNRIAPHLHSAHSLFPSVLCSSVMQIVACLDDAAVSADGCAVYEVAYQVIWVCLVEDSALFLRYVLERLTRDRQDQMFKLLRHLIRFVPRLPQQAAFALYNYIIGYVMFYVRSSHECSQQLVGAALSVLWMVVHSVHGIMFKDLKQILRKEQCDASILLTANVPSAKKIIVHGPDVDGGIPSQFPVQEDTQFCQILRESLDFFGIDEKYHSQHVLVDHKSQKILNPNWYVRDVYFFKRSQYPQLRLIEMPCHDSFNALQKQELIKKFVEIGKVHLTWAILKNVDMVVQRVVFLHEELMKLPSFPRKALEADLDLCHGGELGKELLGLDVLHKFMWVRLIARMFEAMAGNFAYSADIQLFLNVLSGAAILHAEDSCIMRYVMATFINAAFNFKNIFSTNGYFMIMPTLLQVYSLHQTNKLITTTIEYAVKQFYLMNRKPFILQMFGSVSAILDTDEEGTYGEAHKVQSSCLFNLLLSLETPSPDPLNIAELVKEPKPLKAIDFCYHDEDEMVTVLDCITLCVMVVSYSAESQRGYQMLIILEAILPCYLQQIQLPTYIQCESKTEREIILQLAVAVRTMVHNCEGLAKSYNGPYRNSPEHKGSSQRNCSRGPPCSPGLDFEDESHSRYVSDMGRTKNLMDNAEDSEMIRAEYRRPRDVLLSVVGEFISRASTRLTELARKQPNDGKPVELLDVKCHVRLAEIAHSLLKVSPYDPDSMACRGLQRYMQCLLPRADWGEDGLRTALVTILRRLDKVFLKISKKPSIRRNTDWEAAGGLLKGIHETIVRHPYVLHWTQIKGLVSTVQNLIVNEPGATPEGVSSAGAALMSQNPPSFFCSTVVRLVSLQVVSTVEYFSLEQICGGHAEFPSQEKAEGFLMHLLMPLCLKVCSGRGIADLGELKEVDITFLVSATLNAMSPPAGRTGQTTQINRTTGDLRAGSLTFTGSRDAKRPARIAGSLYQAAFLSLRILCICFETRMAKEWPRVVRVMRDLGRRNEAAPELWSFLEFVVTHRTPLYIVLMPFILHKISQPPIGDHERHMQFLIRERMRGMPDPDNIRSRGALLLELARELRDLRETLVDRRHEAKEVPEPNAKRDPSQTSSGALLPAVEPKHQQRPSLISLFANVGVQPISHTSSSVQIDSRSGTVMGTPSDNLSQQAVLPASARGESLSSSSTTTTTHTNKDTGAGGSHHSADSHSVDCPTPTPSLAQSGSSTIVVGVGGSANTLTGGSSVSASHHHVASYLAHSMSLQQQSWKAQQPRLRFVSSVEFRHSSGETSTTPLSPESPMDDSSGETTTPVNSQRPSRLQRSKAQSRKTFRLRRGRQNHGESAGHSTEEEQVPTRSSAAVAAVADVSWDSVSQTSSTSGYRDNYSFQTSLLSPDGSLSGAAPLARSSSQHSMLMLFEAQDEDTLI